MVLSIPALFAGGFNTNNALDTSDSREEALEKAEIQYPGD
jgi:hypothetical protein